jgi:hypothetical protein
VPLKYVTNVLFVLTASDAKADHDPVLPHLDIVLVSAAIVEATIIIVKISACVLIIVILVALLLAVLVYSRARLELVLEIFLGVVLFKLLAFRFT